MNILFVFRSPVGGLFRHVKDLLRGVYEQGHHVGVVFDSKSTISKKDENFLIQYSKIGVWRLPISRLPSLSDFKVLRLISKLVDLHRFDIVHGHGAKGGLFARLVVKFHTNKIVPKSVYTLHGGSLHYHPNSMAGFLFLKVERLLLPSTAGLIFESEFAQQRFLDVIGSPACMSKVIYNGVFESEFEPVVVLPDAADFVFIGELRKLKGVDILLEAVKVIQAKGKIVSLAIFGSGPDEEIFRMLEKDLGIVNVTWHGASSNAREALKFGHYFVLPSLAESLPYVVLECIAAGVPLLATRVGGVPEILGERDNWIIPGDVNDLADKMSKFLDGSYNLAENIKIIQARAKYLFCWERMVNSTLEFYRNCTLS